MKSLSLFKLPRIKKYNDAKTDYGTYGLWGAILAGGKTVVSKSTFRYLTFFAPGGKGGIYAPLPLFGGFVDSLANN